MTASIWDPKSTFIPNVNADSSVLFQKFTATAAQTLFTLTDFAYTLGTNSLLIFKNGDLLVPGIDFTETSSSSFTLPACTGGEKIVAVGFVEISGTSIIPNDGSVTTVKLAAGLLVPISKGGTGATSAAGALAALGAMGLAGGTFTGPVTLNANAATALQPTTLQQVQTLIASVASSAVFDFNSRQTGAGADFFATQPA